MILRKKTKKIKVGNIFIGGDSPITVQSMVKVDAHDVKAVVNQIKQLEEVGCDIIRIGALDMESVKNFSKIKKQISIPLVADIHFDYQLALEAIEQGVDKLRINPGNIGGMNKVQLVAKKAKERGVPIRIGVNAGSIKKELLKNTGGRVTPEIMVESASSHIKMLEDCEFDQIVVSLKSSDVMLMVEAYQLFVKKYDYPVHLGVTEAGTMLSSTVKSSVGLGSLLLQGIGDTIRVSMTDDASEEIKVGKEILKHLGLIDGPILISCPTCSRTEYNMLPLAKKVEKYLERVKAPIKVAVMGCIVNGPGEARDADVGVAGGKGKSAIFVRGKVMKTVPEKDIFNELVSWIEKIIIEKEIEGRKI